MGLRPYLILGRARGRHVRCLRGHAEADLRGFSQDSNFNDNTADTPLQRHPNHQVGQ